MHWASAVGHDAAEQVIRHCGVPGGGETVCPETIWKAARSVIIDVTSMMKLERMDWKERGERGKRGTIYTFRPSLDNKVLISSSFCLRLQYR